MVEIFVQSKQILSTEQLCALALQRHPDLGRATVYRTLEKLIELELVQRIHDQQGCHHYLAVMDDDPQALLICSDCQRVYIRSV
ncbi:transcriptional repressor [Chloroflexi bacterium TSY]|nr:transcriptional repressor [Chloroflexi bacterium TSY]